MPMTSGFSDRKKSRNPLSRFDRIPFTFQDTNLSILALEKEIIAGYCMENVRKTKSEKFLTDD